ncbi:MAG TPA: ABC transporter permease subunit [Sedimentisphaerales bacterium]|nr:ABC transporter permease subunit [Sedimentisphaerales bacterium]
MNTALIKLVLRLVSLSWLTGPIFDKELRVSSRRRRNYVLRFVYLGLLTTFLVLVWLQFVTFSGSALMHAAQMAEAGKAIVTMIIWFQFCAIQLVAIIMLSAAISDEIYNRTLGLLMTTPINSFQIVMGKLFSRLLQLILLMAISLPLLAIVRVFGGVPWNYLAAGLCITISTVIFVGSLSLFFSIYSRRPYVVIILTFLTLGVIFALLPLLAALWLHGTVSEKEFFGVLRYVNPYAELALITDNMMSPRGVVRATTTAWLNRCGITLAASVLILCLSALKVRKAALRQVVGESSPAVRPGGKTSGFNFTCLALSAMFVFIVWIVEFRYRAPGRIQFSAVSHAGRIAALAAVGIQFLAVQVITIIRLAGSMQKQTCRPTPDAPPPSAIQTFLDMTGSLLGWMCRLTLFLAVSLPLLAMLRFPAGLPWDYIIAALCITLIAALFTGTLGLFFATFTRKTYMVVILTASALVAALVIVFFRDARVAPFVIGSTREIVRIPRLSLILTCSVLLCISALVWFMALIGASMPARRRNARHVHKASDSNPAGEEAVLNQPKPAGEAAVAHVSGPPILWKELRSTSGRTFRIPNFIIASVLLFFLFTTYFLCAKDNVLGDNETHILYAAILMGLGILFTIILPAASITSEKEARSWPLLLTTTLSDNEILFGKFVGGLRRCLPVWLLLFGHFVLFTLLGYIHPVAVLQMAILVAWVVTFLCCSGLYFSSRFRRTTTAVIVNFALAAAVWILLPLLLVMIYQIANLHRTWFDSLAQACVDANPVFQGCIVADATARGWHRISRYNWCELNLDAVESTLFMLAFMLLYMLLAWIFVWRARRRLRRNVF